MSNHDPFSPSAAVSGGQSSAPKNNRPDTRENNDPQGQRTVQSSEKETAPAGEGQRDNVPQGTASEVFNWVGGDRGRARQAIERENASGEPRKNLVGRLERIASGKE